MDDSISLSRIINGEINISNLYQHFTLKIAKLEQENLQLKLDSNHVEKSLTYSQKTEMELENIRLKSRVFQLEKSFSEAIILREENKELKDKIESLNSFRRKAIELEAQLEFEREKISPVRNSIDTSMRQSLEKERTILKAENGELSTQLKLLKTNLLEKIQEASNLDELLLVSEKKNETLIQKLKLQDSRIIYLKKEVDLYRSLSESVENLENAAIPLLAKDIQSQILSLLENFRTQNFSLMKKCDEELSKLNECLDDFESKSHSVSTGSCLRSNVKRPFLEPVSFYNEDLSSKNDIVIELRERLKSIEEQLENRTNENKCLKKQLEAFGDCDEGNVQVLHFKMNPYDKQRQDKEKELSDFRKRNEKLRQRCALLEQQVMRISEKRSVKQNDESCVMMDTMNITATVEANVQMNEDPMKEIKSLKEELKHSEVRNLKMIEVFTECKNSIYQAILMIFGCRLDLRAPGIYRITFLDPRTEKLSSKDHSITFKFDSKNNSGKNWEILEGLSPLMNCIPNWSHWLELSKRTQCVPVLTANLTLEFMIQQGVNIPSGSLNSMTTPINYNNIEDETMQL